VKKRYGSVTAIDGLDLDVRTGELLGVLGPDGAAKSTAIAVMLGTQCADAGEVLMFGRLPSDLRTRRRIGD